MKIDELIDILVSCYVKEILSSCMLERNECMLTKTYIELLENQYESLDSVIIYDPLNTEDINNYGHL